ncbi:hypothetical protein Zmor_019550 [Zophobas morio]|uniref:Protein yellow n=1 Tax=Zophobas morio TaxID=2755281 RepID=A0AA38I217_9CUCU|nr:hypothetical protein Zmor_019550 [Zophobas morio]
MGPAYILPLLFGVTFAMDNLEVAYQWKQLDFAYPSEEARREAIKSGEFTPANNLPLGLEVHDDRLFITVPRWRKGVAASLGYIKLSDPMDSPKLHPYPNWQAHNLSGSPEIISPFRMRADKCGRLWVLDTGEEDILGEAKIHQPTTLLIYDLSTNTLMRKYQIPENQTSKDSFFANIAVEDHNCSNSFAYLGDLGDHPAIVVYSWKNNTSWKVKHHYFHIDPLMCDFSVTGIDFRWNDGIFGMALSKPDAEGYSTLYFHPMSSAHEFAVSTKYLREDVSDKNFHKFRNLGSRGPKSQSGTSFLDQNTGVLFYALLNLNAVACWRTTNAEYTMHSQGRVFMNNVTMVFPNDIKVDSNDVLWVLSDRLPTFMYKFLDENEVNFRIFKAKVADAIRRTACDSTFEVNSTTIKTITIEKRNVGFKVESVMSIVLVALVAIYSL